MTDFDREEYLASAWWFEQKRLEDVERELCEFNSDAEDLAWELAYTRYALAKAEKDVRRLLLLATKHCDKKHHDWLEVLKIAENRKEK